MFFLFVVQGFFLDFAALVGGVSMALKVPPRSEMASVFVDGFFDEVGQGFDDEAAERKGFHRNSNPALD